MIFGVIHDRRGTERSNFAAKAISSSRRSFIFNTFFGFCHDQPLVANGMGSPPQVRVVNGVPHREIGIASKKRGTYGAHPRTQRIHFNTRIKCAPLASGELEPVLKTEMPSSPTGRPLVNQHIDSKTSEVRCIALPTFAEWPVLSALGTPKAQLLTALHSGSDLARLKLNRTSSTVRVLRNRTEQKRLYR